MAPWEETKEKRLLVARTDLQQVARDNYTHTLDGPDTGERTIIGVSPDDWGYIIQPGKLPADFWKGDDSPSGKMEVEFRMVRDEDHAQELRNAASAGPLPHPRRATQQLSTPK